MTNDEVRVDTLASGDVFQIGTRGEEPGPTNVYRIEIVRSRTILARDVGGSRRSFGRRTFVRRSDAETWARLEEKRRAQPGAIPRAPGEEVA